MICICCHTWQWLWLCSVPEMLSQLFSPFYMIKPKKVNRGDVEYPSAFSREVIIQMSSDKVQPLITALICPFDEEIIV